MTSLAITAAARMGTRAGEVWRTTKTPTRNPFRHPATAALAAEWRRAYIAAATRPDSVRPSPRGVTTAALTS